MRDYETVAAIKTKWEATAALVAAVPGGLLEPPVPEGDNVEQRRPRMPYATVTSEPDGGLLSSGGEIDYRRVKIAVYGNTKAEVNAAGAIVDATFSEQELDIENADWMRTEPPQQMRGGKLERGEKINEGETWRATFEYRVWTSRPQGV